MPVFEIYLIFSMLAVIWFDVTRYIIPNWLVGSLLLLYPLAVYMSPVPIDWHMALLGATIIFAAGYVVFALNLMGGGDIKLITVAALWVGWTHLLDFIFIVAVLGGVLSVVLWGTRKIMPYVAKSRTLPRILKEGEPAPYGIAISLGVLILLAMGQVSVVSVR